MSRRLERPSLVAPSLVVAALAIGVGLSASFAGAAAAKVEREFFYLFARLRINRDLPYRHPAVVADVGMVLILVLGRWCAWGALDFSVAMKLPLRGPCLGVCHHRRGFLRCQRPNFLMDLTISKAFGRILFVEATNGGRMAELLEDIGHNIRRLREQKGWNQTELGFHANASPSIISLIENGKRNPSTTTLAKIAGAMGVDVVDLFPKKVQQQVPLWRAEEESEQRHEPENVWEVMRKLAFTQRTQISDPNSRAEWETLERNLKDLVAENSALRARVAELREELAKVREETA
jgi:transcriptional regulator with XRE-family HTH domain